MGGRSHWDQWKAIGPTGCIRSFGSCDMRPRHGCHPTSRATSVDLQTSIDDRSSRCVALQAVLLRKGPQAFISSLSPRQNPQLYFLGRVGRRRSYLSRSSSTDDIVVDPQPRKARKDEKNVVIPRFVIRRRLHSHTACFPSAP